MSTEEITQVKRPRGRPRKNPEPVPEKVEAVVDAMETAAMQEQIRYQLVQLLKLAQNLGVDLSDTVLTPDNVGRVAQEKLRDLYPTPPSDTVHYFDNESPEAQAAERRRKPGELTAPGAPNTGWIPWTKADLDAADLVEFVPLPVPSIIYPIPDENGHQKIFLDVNDLKCALTVGVPNRVNRFFYNAYMNAYDTWRELESFKRQGPAWAPWGATDPQGRRTWHFDASAVSFGMDDEGRYLAQGRNFMRPMPTVEEPAPEPI